jgi:glycosyltransferase involved in cell wall biosynthesis
VEIEVNSRGKMHRRPRLLFLCQTLPYPPDGGVQIRTYNVFRLLAEAFEITALCFYRWKGGAVQRAVADSVAALGKLGAVEAFRIPQEHSRRRWIRDHLRSLLAGRAYTDFVYESADYESRLRGLLASTRFDIVHADSLDLARYFPLVDGTPVVCVHHNVESALMRRRAQAERTWWRRAYLEYQAGRLEDLVRHWGERVALNITVSEEDRHALQRFVPAGRFTVVPNGVDVDYFKPDPGRDEGMVFVGGSTWFPNRDALRYFCESILPLLRQQDSSASVTWVGRSSEAECLSYARRYRIRLTGYVDDIRPHVRDAACYVVPLRVGGGTRLKILDAWAMGKAVVSTSIGCEGLAARDGENILVRDTALGFAEAVRDVLRDRELRERLGVNGRATVERLYSWKVIAGPMIERYMELLPDRRPDKASIVRSGASQRGIS